MHRLLLVICVVLGSLPLAGQDRAAIDGTVIDPTGAVVGSATVELLSPETGLRRQSSTNERGIYEFPSLPVGSYTVTITKPGFKPFVIRTVDLLYAQTRTLDARLEVGTTTETRKLPRPWKL